LGLLRELQPLPALEPSSVCFENLILGQPEWVRERCQLFVRKMLQFCEGESASAYVVQHDIASAYDFARTCKVGARGSQPSRQCCRQTQGQYL
jgi:hypothetical protein